MSGQAIQRVMANMLDAFGEDGPTFKNVVNHKHEISTLAKKARSTKFFKHAQQNQVQKKLLSVLYEHATEDRPVAAFLQMLEKICDAPTSAHAIGVVVVYMPIIDQFLEEIADGSQCQ